MMAPDEVKAARKRLGWTQTQLAEALLLGGDGKRAVRRWEKDGKTTTGPVSVAIEALLTGWRPAHMRDSEAA